MQPVRTKTTPPVARRRHDGLRARWQDESFRREVVALGLLMLCALVLRVAWLGTVPGNITADEADNLATIFHIEVTGEPGFFGLDWKPQPAMSMYLFRASMAVFGNDIFGMRMASAILSTLALLPYYALARRVVQPLAALAGAALLATGLWYLNFSRSGWENVHVAFYALLAAWTLTVALERRQLRWFALAGVAAALGLYGYFAGRLILVALLAYAPLALVLARGYRWKVVAGYVLLAGTALLLFWPQMSAINEDRELFNRRTDRVNVFKQPKPYMGQDSNLGIVQEQLKRNVKGFFLFDGSMFTSGRYAQKGETLYDPVTGVLMLSGLVIGLYHWRKTGLWWAMLFIPLLGTQVASIGTPNGARALIVAPFMYLFVALTIDALLDLARGPGRRYAVAAVVAGVLLVSVANVTSYINWIRSPETLKAREPAVQLADYELWRETLMLRYARNEATIHVGKWNEIVSSLRPSTDYVRP